ncbi:MAG: sigma-54-dependent Fis family transcriptional regulator [Desulfobulbaceae bacterium]|uniref:Sigma-54-dependent Fis family transcriptional regulator n=1 Tax=Candidatus Desulfobia pelagia TaxID=2841692 RepID=A0A8J6TET7_9BACT|nr:sigma-54-dependent Fis family transcriptional regulator [Candidatus Desulfobia pelagia]
MKNTLVISQDSTVFDLFQENCSPEDTLFQATALAEGLDLMKNFRVDLIFIDMEILYQSAEKSSYKTVLQSFWMLYPSAEIVVITPQKMLREAVQAVKQGVSDYITYPVIAEEIRLVEASLSESQKVQSELDYLREEAWDKEELDIVQTRCPGMRKVFDNVRSVAPTRSTVLLTGETGTGKGLLAKIIHKHSNRRDEQFISVHCGAIPDTLLESELFGHEKGAFTGAVKRKLGKFEIAGGGTIFLDEIGTITPAAQIKLLQVLQDSTFQRLGGEETIQVNIRIIAASNIDLKQLCNDQVFRNDLYYRLNVFPIELPPLRERKEDIAQLIQVFLNRLNKFDKKNIHDVHPQVTEASLNYSWPGNIRELENVMERAYILERSTVLMPDSFPAELFAAQDALSRVKMDTLLSLSDVRRQGVEEIERRYLKEILEKYRGKINKSAEAAGITTRQLHKLMIKHGLKKEEFKRGLHSKD